MAKRDFPKQLYIGIDNDGDDEGCFVAHSDYEDLSYQDDAREIAIYALVRVTKVVNKSEVV
jgi:hypothetical protein